MTGYFITATGTGIGKTFTTCALLYAAKNARGYKPVISGWSEDAGTDTAQIIVAGGSNQTPEEVSPWRFAAPLSPHRAAALEGRELDAEALVEWTRARADGQVFIETVGGVMVPLTNEMTALDWMQAAQLPVILVTGSYLGTISHTLTAIEVLRARGIAIKALVMNESENSAVAFDEVQAGLSPFIHDISLQIFQPRVSSWREATEIHRLAGYL